MEYVIGLDFGTLSARAVIFSCKDGSEVGEGFGSYKHGVMTDKLPNGTELEQDYALESPFDIKESLRECVQQAIKNSKINPSEIIGIGIDATTYSVLPVKADGTPLCALKEFESSPMAWIKLWKHHGAQVQSNKLALYHKKTGKLVQCNRYGGVFNCEWGMPKLLETYEKAPQVFKAADKFCDLGEWVAWILSGHYVASKYSYGFKCLWSEDLKFPTEETLNEISDGFGTALYKKISMQPMGYEKPCGYLTKEMALHLGLKEGIAIATPMGDGSAPGVSICAKHRNSIAITYGTSVAMAFISDQLKEMKGINGVVKDCFYPGLYAYDAGQPSAGDMLAWFAENYVNPKITEESKGNVHAHLTELAKQDSAWNNRLSVLDWFGGNRSIINDSSLRGVIAGLGLDTKPHEIYCAMIQGICCGSKRAVDYFEENGIEFDKIIVLGGIADKNRFFLNQLANIFNRKIYYCKGFKVTALGSAILACVAAGKNYDNVLDAMCPKNFEEILPDKEHEKQYMAIYDRWCNYHDALAKEAKS